MAGSQGGGYPGPPSAPTAPSAPSAPPAPSAYSGQQAWQPPSYSSSPSNYSSAASSYSSAPSSYSSAPPSLSYSDSMRAQYNSQNSFSSSPPYGDPQQLSTPYGQSQNTYGQPQKPAGYGQAPYGDPTKLSSSFQSQGLPSYGQPASPSTYGQPQPGSYGQPQPSAYGQTQPSSYGKPTTQPASYGQPPASTYGQPPVSPYGQPSASPYGQAYGQSQYSSAGTYPPPPYGAPYGQAGKPKVKFPPGTDPEIIRAFEMGDLDGSGLIDAAELGRVLSTGLPFSMRTVHLMLHLYSTSASSKIGPTEFSALWIALKEWKVCFERFDRDRSGRIDYSELRDGLLSMGYAISPPLLQILISKYDRTGQSKALDYDNFVECGLVVKGLTDRFKAKDTRFTGSATLDYESFMQMVLPFIVA